MHYISSWCNPIDSTWSSIQSHKFYANLENEISQSTFTCYKIPICTCSPRSYGIKYYETVFVTSKCAYLWISIPFYILSFVDLFLVYVLFSPRVYFHLYIFLEMENFSMFIINKFSNKFSSVIFEIDFIGFYSEPYSQWDIFNLM